MSRLTWWNHLIHIGIRCLDSVLNGGSFTHRFPDRHSCHARISFDDCLFARMPGWTRTNGSVRFLPCHSESVPIVRARVTCLSSEFIRSRALSNTANARLRRINSWYSLVCSLVYTARFTNANTSRLIALLRYKRTFAAYPSCSQAHACIFQTHLYGTFTFTRIYALHSCLLFQWDHSFACATQYTFTRWEKVAYSTFKQLWN